MHKIESVTLFSQPLASIPVIYSNKGLRFWEGGCTWIDEGQAVLQLRKSFATKERYLWIYSKQELLQHEAVHLMRQHMKEPIFEEVLAYRTSSSRLRRFLGPFFRTPRESLLFVPLLLFLPFTMIAYYLLGALTLFGMIRLFWTQAKFKRALHHFTKELGSQEKALSHMLFLTDKEILSV
ncbi:MAG: hypothetical protein ACKVOH_05610 [Chlamydiales bacterium]